MMNKIEQEIDRLQKMAEQWLPEDIRDDYYSIEHALMSQQLSDLEHLAGQVVLWTCDMFENIES
jgi:hypothetical protein